MEKTQLKTVIAGLTAGQDLTVNFIGNKAAQSGDYTVTKIRTGRGKGGSRLLELTGQGGRTLTTGTPDSDVILNMTVNGTFHGYRSETEIPPVYEKNATQAAFLKEQFKALVNATGTKSIRMQSTVPEYTGTFRVTLAEQLKGRGGQVRLSLENEFGGTMQLWSYRHSGIITSLEIL